MKKNILYIIILFLPLMLSCSKDPEVPNEQEVITTLTYTLTPDGGGDDVVFRFQDLDGDGGNNPVISSSALDTNATYTAVIELLNEQSPDDVEDITEEIMEKDADHQFFFQTDVTGLTVEYLDQDGDGNPVGLKTRLTTTNTGSGTLTIILRHEPQKDATGVSDGDITNAGGETDIEVTFDIDVQ